MDKVKTSDRTAEEEKFLEGLRAKNYNVVVQEDPLYLHRPPPGLGEYHDPVNHPSHYNNSSAACECGRRIECIDITRHHTFNIGNAIKYLWRCDFKGNSIEDLKKAIWYITDEIKEREKTA